MFAQLIVVATISATQQLSKGPLLSVVLTAHLDYGSWKPTGTSPH